MMHRQPIQLHDHLTLTSQPHSAMHRTLNCSGHTQVITSEASFFTLVQALSQGCRCMVRQACQGKDSKNTRPHGRLGGNYVNTTSSAARLSYILRMSQQVPFACHHVKRQSGKNTHGRAAPDQPTQCSMLQCFSQVNEPVCTTWQGIPA